jgi:hypothetical protein
MRMRRLLAMLCLMFLVPIFDLLAQGTNGREVMMQGFNWESKKFNWYNILNNSAGDLAASKIDAIWLPPPSDAASPDGYLPRQLYVLSNAYGTEAQHRAAVTNLKNHNVKVIADIVINHRVGTTGWGDFTNPTWGCWAVVNGDSWAGACGNNDTGSMYDPARDLDHTNQTVRNDLKAWMNWLKNDVGYDGWRYDYVHGFGANYIKEYNDATSPYFSVGELWDGNRQNVMNWINGTQGSSTAFDFPLKYVLHRAVEGGYWELNDNGNPPGLIGWWPSRSVTFIDNHDTGSTQAYSPFPSNRVMLGYAYILTHPGYPMIFWDHFYDWGLKSQIQALIDVRKDNDLHAESTVSIQKSDNAYAAIIDGKVAMKIGAGAWSPSGSGWVLRASGTDYAVWDRGASSPPSTSTFTVHFKRPANWSGSSTRIHHWSAIPTGSLANSTWPGVEMEAEGNGWFKHTFHNIANTNLLFHNNAGTQTVDLNRGSEGWYMDGAWHNSNPEPPANTPPVVSVNPAGPYTTTSSFTATISATDDSGIAPTIYYTTDGSTPTESSPSAVGSVNVTINASLTLRVFAKDNEGLSSAIQSHEYTINPISTSTFTVHFKRPTNWSGSATRIHHWGALPTSSLANSTWPGVEMVPSGNGWFRFTFNDIASTNLLFHNNGGTQTIDLSRDKEGWYMNGAWYDTNPEPNVNQPPVVAVNPAGPHTAASAITVTVSATDDSGIAPTIYYTLDGSTPTESSLSAVGSINVQVSASLTLSVFAKDNEGLNSAVQTHQYTINPPSTSTFTVHFKRPANWSGSATRIHHWGAQPTGVLANTTWPGVDMTSTGNGWYTYTFNDITSTNLLFHNNAGTQTTDLSRDREGWYMDGAWYNVNPEPTVNEAPIVSVNPVGPFTSSTAFTASISAVDDSGIAPTIYYTTDGSTPTESSPSAVGSVNVPVDESLTLKVFAKDDEGLSSAIQTHVYTINTSSNSFTVYFHRPANWGSNTPRIHHWGAQPNGALANSTWPGVEMTQEGSNGWFKFTFNDITSTNLLFHNNAGTQTADLTRGADGWYINGAWSNTDPRINPTGLTIHLKTNWANPRMHYWNVTPTGVAANTTWPGVTMVPEGNGWYKYTIPDATCANLIFSNNGASQTADLYRCGEGWYMNGTWFSSFPEGGFAQEFEDGIFDGPAFHTQLDQNYPNPSYGTTTFAFTLQERTYTHLGVYNMMGHNVATLVNHELGAGEHSVSMDVSNLSDGIYIYRLITNGKVISKRMVVRK